MSSNITKPTNQSAARIANYRLNRDETFAHKDAGEKMATNGYGYRTHLNSGENSPQREGQQELKAQNIKLKKMLKEAQAKRFQITKQCSELANKFERLEEQNTQLHRKIKDVRDVGEGEKFRYEQLKFLNKQLGAQIEQLQRQNQSLSEKLKHHAEVLEKKYEEIEQRTYKRIEQALKRIKKGIHYLSTLSIKEIQKTREIQIQNLSKAADVLKGKYNQNNKFEQQIEELMNPIRNIQEELHQKIKELTVLKQENSRLNNEVKKHKKIEKEVLPQYKEAIEKLKKNLGQVRMQLSENEYDKMHIKRKYQEKIKQVEIKYEQLFTEHRKLKLENKIFEKKIQEMEDDVEEEKQRLIGENELLKKLYKSQDEKSRRSVEKDLGVDGYLSFKNEEDIQIEHHTEALSHKTTSNKFRRPADQHPKLAMDEQVEQEKNNRDQGERAGKNLKKNYSASQLLAASQKQETEAYKSRLRAPLRLRQNPVPKYQVAGIAEGVSSGKSGRNYGHLRHTQERRSDYESKNKSQISDQWKHQEDQKWQEENQEEESEGNAERQESSAMSVSQDGLKNQIFKIDQEIMEIQKTLDRQLNMYK